MYKAEHATFVIERTLAHPPAAVFAAFATEAGKQRWFSGPNEKWKLMEREFEFRPGGKELLSGRWNDSGMVSQFEATYFDIVPNARIVYGYEMRINEKKISVSLATIEIKPEGKGARLTITEQGAFLDGYDDAGSRERGTRELIERMAASLDQRPA
jgi:uncharacterized protein YndB with AHSA1/START domain